MIVRAAEEYDELSFWQKRRRDGDIPQPPGVGSFSTLRRTESRVVVFPYAAGYLPPHLSVLPDGSVCSSLLDCVVRTGVPELFDNATIRAVIQFKWSTHVSSVFMFRFIVYIIALAGLLAMPFLMQPRSPVDQPTTPRRLATMVIAVVVGLLALYDGYHELLQIIKDVRTRNHGFVTSMKRYIFDFWNARDVVQLWLTGLAIGFYFAFGDSPTTRRPLSLAIYCKAVGLLYFLQAYHDTGTIVHIIISVIHDSKSSRRRVLLRSAGFCPRFAEERFRRAPLELAGAFDSWRPCRISSVMLSTPILCPIIPDLTRPRRPNPSFRSPLVSVRAGRHPDGHHLCFLRPLHQQL